jgi:hypothetical protein
LLEVAIAEHEDRPTQADGDQPKAKETSQDIEPEFCVGGRLVWGHFFVLETFGGPEEPPKQPLNKGAMKFSINGIAEAVP